MSQDCPGGGDGWLHIPEGGGSGPLLAGAALMCQEALSAAQGASALTEALKLRTPMEEAHSCGPLLRVNEGAATGPGGSPETAALAGRL